MADYLKDEQDREERRRQEALKQQPLKITSRDSHTNPNKDEEKWEVVNLEIKDETFLRVAREAHRRDITFNKMVNIILRDKIQGAEYRFEHNNDPQFLAENY